MLMRDLHSKKHAGEGALGVPIWIFIKVYWMGRKTRTVSVLEIEITQALCQAH
jgi:hypothetical protein